MSNWTASIFATGIEALRKNQSTGRSSLIATLSSVARYPLKAIAAFITAPFLAYRVARSAKNPFRRMIASVGLVLAVLLALGAGTFLGTVAGGILIYSAFGPLIALGFILGTALSVILSVTFSIFVLNATSWLFLHMSSEDVIEYLKTLSE